MDANDALDARRVPFGHLAYEREHILKRCMLKQRRQECVLMREEGLGHDAPRVPVYVRQQERMIPEGQEYERGTKQNQTQFLGRRKFLHFIYIPDLCSTPACQPDL